MSETYQITQRAEAAWGVNGVGIRRLQPGETALFKHLRLTALQDAPEAFSSTYADALQRTEESWQAQAESTTQGSDRATFIAFYEQTPIGMAGLYRMVDQPEVGELIQMWLSPEYCGTGLAQQLLDAVIGWAQENGFCRIFAGVRGTNPRALKFYTRLGFSTLEEASPKDPDSNYLVKDIL